MEVRFSMGPSLPRRRWLKDTIMAFAPVQHTNGQKGKCTFETQR